MERLKFHKDLKAYARVLQAAGVPVELYEVKGAMHGYDIAAESELLKIWMAKRILFLKESCI